MESTGVLGSHPELGASWAIFISLIYLAFDLSSHRFSYTEVDGLRLLFFVCTHSTVKLWPYTLELELRRLGHYSSYGLFEGGHCCAILQYVSLRSSHAVFTFSTQ